LQYIDRLQKHEPNCLVTIVIPEFVPTGWWPKLLHGQAGLMLGLRLRFKHGVVVITVPYHIEGYLDLAAPDSTQSTQLDDATDGHRSVYSRVNGGMNGDANGGTKGAVPRERNITWAAAAARLSSRNGQDTKN
jgi:hypothetical protein